MADNNDEMQEFIEDFLVESQELIETVDEDLITLEKKPDNLELLNGIFRAVHTIKGTSSFIGLNVISKFTHHVENVLNKLRNAELKLDPDIMDTILESVDIIKGLMEDIKSGEPSGIDISEVTKKLSVILSENSVAVAGTTPPSEEEKRSAPEKVSEKAMKREAAATEEASDKTPAEKKAKTKKAKPKKAKKKAPVKKEENKYENKKLGEILVEKNLVSEEDLSDALDKQDDKPRLGKVLLEEGKIKKKDLDGALKLQGKAAGVQIEQSIRVGINRLDSLMNIVSELVLGRNRLIQVGKYFEEKYESESMTKSLTELSDSFDLLTADLHTALMKVRMVPINKVFSKYPRLVREVSRGTGKKVELELSGGDTELDKSVCENINDPLVHLLRNSVDHGIEGPEERKAKNKPLEGTVKLSARHEGNDVIIEIEDDGKGIDIDSVKEKAVQKKLYSQQEVDRMSDREVFDLIFEPGFSTAKKVTNVSGRGVGMDVVKTNIAKLKGVIEIDSEKDKGTVVRLKIPLTLEIMQALIIGVNGDYFAIPLTSVLEIVSLEDHEIKTIKGSEVINLRDSILALARLDDLFSVQNKDNKKNSDKKSYVVVAGIAEKKLGVVVSDLIGKEDIVIKPIENYAYSMTNISGATIMGDGRVCLVIDVSGLLKQAALAT